MSKELARMTANEALAPYGQDKYNVLMPQTALSSVPQGAAISVRTVTISQDLTYSLEGGKLGLSGVALDKIAQAAGITWTECRRTDPRTHPYYVEYEVTGQITDFDGSVRVARGVRAIDLRDNAGDGNPGADLAEIQASASAKGGNPAKRILFAKKFIVPICEAKAKNRAIRRLLAIKGGYTPDELKKPFVVPKLVLDSNDNLARSMMLANLAGVRAPALPVQATVIDAEPEPELEETQKAAIFVENETTVGVNENPFEMVCMMAKSLGLNDQAFADLARKVTGKKTRHELTLADIERISDALVEMAESRVGK